MFSSKFYKSKRLWAFTIALLTVAGFFISVVQPNAAAGEKSLPTSKMNTPTMFSATPESLKPVPSSLKSKNCRAAVPTSMDVIFNVSEMKGAVKNIAVNNLTFDPQFKWGAGLTAVLISPDGSVSQTLFGEPKTKNCFAVTNFTETYSYTNESLNAAFSKVSNPNGAWILRLTDNAGGQLGTVQNVSLAISTESPTVGSAPIIPTNADFDADGKTDFVVIRASSDNSSNKNLAPSPRQSFYAPKGQKRLRRRLTLSNAQNLDGDPINWYVSSSATNAFSSAVNGDASTDSPIPADFDGDGKNDFAVWRPSDTQSVFYILQSSTNTLRVDNFGLANDDPTVVADYDGDKKADPATFRCPEISSPAGQCYFFYRGSLNNPNNQLTYVPWGFGNLGDFTTYPGDFDGDGKADFCIQRADPNNPDNGQFVLLKSADFKYEYINWGYLNDLLLPGDYDGDKKTDFCVSRYETTPTDPNFAVSYYILPRAGGGTPTSPIRFGYDDDVPVPGDYDGDGKTDIGVWRPVPDATDPTPTLPKFIIYRSSDKKVIYYGWGLSNDLPVAGWQAK